MTDLHASLESRDRDGKRCCLLQDPQIRRSTSRHDRLDGWRCGGPPAVTVICGLRARTQRVRDSTATRHTAHGSLLLVSSANRTRRYEDGSAVLRNGVTVCSAVRAAPAHNGADPHLYQARCSHRQLPSNLTSHHSDVVNADVSSTLHGCVTTETCPQKTAVRDDRPTRVDSALKCVAKCRAHEGAATALFYGTGVEHRLSVRSSTH